MKTLIISDGAPMPAALRDVVQRGSTVLQERHVDELDASRIAQMNLDRIVFWSPSGSAALREIARDCAKADAVERRETMVYVVGDEGITPESVPQHERFVWPRDEDRLKMAFMTGA
ncbi:MAG: hypothetical protein LC753_02130 [Acidobacteria bacterium]|nr:hypothetical protein [Acidobacteriota bacterium]MCA1649103.1 hypothetical protein [Acidobacteriota bacterium]